LKQTVLDCLDQLEQLIEDGMTLPFAGKKVINSLDALEIIDQIRIILPEELRQAALTAERVKTSHEGRHTNSYVQPIINISDRMNLNNVPKITAPYRRPEPNSIFPNSEVVINAKQEAERILAAARFEANELKKGADEYSKTTLANLEETLNRTTKTIKNGLQELERRKMYIDKPISEKEETED